MLNSKKLLYILPDVAYIAELLPTKKEHQFSIQSFRQVNGDFLDDNTFIADNVKKLIGKLDPEEYHLILPDFLFTNTIVEVQETTQSKIDAHLKDKLLPELGLSKDTHSIDTFVLTQLKDTSKVQLSALEKEVMNPVAEAAADKGLTITGISPLSWTTKAMISLEPSISLIQMGSMLYLAQHYIGIDQATSSEIDNIDKIAETIKTLKGAEQSIQTLYLLTNELVQEKLAETLHDTLPIQQLTKPSDKEKDMPQFVKQIIETGMRTLDIDDFPVPTFALEKVSGSDSKAAAAAAATTVASTTDTKSKEEEKEEQPDETEETESEKEDDVVEMDATEEEALPEPTQPKKEEDEEAETDSQETATSDDTDTPVSDVESTSDNENDSDDVSSPADESAQETENESSDKDESEDTTDSSDDETPEKSAKESAPLSDSPKSTSSDEKPMVESGETPKQVIKNKTNTGTMVKMIFITLAVLFATVAIGVGLGLGILKLSNRGQSNLDENPVVVTSPTPETTPSPTPEPEPEVDPSELSILVVNATTIAGKAGDIGAELEDADFGTVDAGNAKGDYDSDANYVLMEEENTALIDLLEEATGLTFVFSDEVSVEDAQGEYDAVVVFADEGSDATTEEDEPEEEPTEETSSTTEESEE